eukprot:15366104-Ditylum_brightwellii.AAC.1
MQKMYCLHQGIEQSNTVWYMTSALMVIRNDMKGGDISVKTKNNIAVGTKTSNAYLVILRKPLQILRGKMPISSRAYGKMARKATTKIEFAVKDNIIQQWKPTDSGNKVPEKILEEKEEQKHNAQVTGLTARRKINTFVDAKLSQANNQTEEETTLSIQTTPKPKEHTTTKEEKANYGLIVDVSMTEAQEETKDGMTEDEEQDQAIKVEEKAWIKEDLKNKKKWEQLIVHEEGKMYEYELLDTYKDTEKEEKPRPSKDILASINSMEATNFDDGTKYEDAMEPEQQALQEEMKRELAEDTKEHDKTWTEVNTKKN